MLGGTLNLGSVNDRDEELSSGMKQRLDFQKRQEAILKKDALNSEEDSEPQYCWANTMSDD